MTDKPCDRCHAARFCTRRCYAFKDWAKQHRGEQNKQSTEVIRVTECKYCKAPIVWLKTPKGKWMCADEGLVRYRQNPEGKDLLVSDRGEIIRCDIIPDDTKLGLGNMPTGMARRPHWATCPHADQARAEKR